MKINQVYICNNVKVKTENNEEKIQKDGYNCGLIVSNKDIRYILKSNEYEKISHTEKKL